MSYRSRNQSHFRIEVAWSQRDLRWETTKFKGEELIRSSQAPELQQFIIQTELYGPEPDEPIEPFRSCKQTASVGAFLFAPTPRPFGKVATAP